jgi:hypothetical protein
MPEPERRSRYRIPLIIFTSSIAAFLLSIPLCSGFNLEGSNQSTRINIGVFFFIASIVGTGVSILWLIIAALSKRN